MERKPTLKELLAKHNISYPVFYEYCVDVPTEDIALMYTHHTCTRSGLEKMLRFINNQAGTAYAIEDVHVAKMFLM